MLLPQLLLLQVMQWNRQDLKPMQNNLDKIEHMVDSAMKKLSTIEKRVDSLEQYG